MPNRLYLIDVFSLLFQVFHAIPEMIGARGQPTNAVFGMTRDILTILRKEPSHIVCAIDVSGPGERDAIFADYKANRSAMPDSLVPQVPMVCETIEAFGIPLVGHAGWEADDVIATLARQAAAAGIDVYIVSNDKDFRQLISPQIHIYSVRKDSLLGETELWADWGVRPEQVIDYQSLVGDSVDNVPGVPGIGPKTATTLLTQFGTLDELLKRTDEVKGNKVRENLKKFADQALMSRQLVTLNTTLPLEFDLETARIGRYDIPKLEALFTDFAFKRLKDDVRRLKPTAAAAVIPPKAADKQAVAFDFMPGVEIEVVFTDEATPASAVEAVKRPLTFTVVDTPEKFATFLAELESQPVVCFDLETTSLNEMQADIVGWAFSWQPLVGWYLPVRGPEGAALLDPVQTADALRPILESGKVSVVNQNIKYDLLVLRRIGIRPAAIGVDSMIASFLLDAGARTHGLDELAKRHLGHEMIPISNLIGKGLFARTMDQVDVAEVAEYAAEDAEVAFDLAQRLGSELKQQNLWSLYWDLERPLIEVLVDMQAAGITVDPTKLREQSARVGEQLVGIKEEIFKLAGKQFNIDSPKQLQTILFTDLGLPSRRKTGTGENSTGQEVLEQLAHLHPLPAKILEHRKLSKLKGTYLDALPQLIDPQTGRIHTSFSQVSAATGRLSSSDPNLQNIPIRADEGRKIREAFLAAPDHVLLCADYSQIELRILAHYSGDAALQAAFAAGVDIHTAVAAQVYAVPPEQVTSEQRAVAKAVNFGIMYGQSPYGLAMSIGISKDDASEFIDQYFAKYAGVDRYMQTVLENCIRDGGVSTILGRRRAIAGIKSSTGRQRNLPERLAINTVIQGSAADLIKQAMINLHGRLRREYPRAQMLLQIHDELVLEVPRDLLAQVAPVVRHEMEHALDLAVPLKVDMTVGADWLNQEDLVE